MNSDKDLPIGLEPEHLLEEFVKLLQNNPGSGTQLLQNLMNIDYDIKSKDTLYNILNEDQRKMMEQMHELRLSDPAFDQQVQKCLLFAGGSFLFGYGIVKLIEHLDKS